MRVAYVTEQGVVIYKKGRRLGVARHRQTIATLRLAHLDQVILWGHIRVTPGALALLMDHGVDTVFVSAHGRFRGRLVGPASKNIFLRWAQFQRAQQTAFALDVARHIVGAKIHNSRTLLRHRLRHRPEHPVLTDALAQLRAISHAVPQADTLDRLRGLEGEAAAVYFRALGACLDEPFFRFERRTRRPPEDPTNALLSLLYTLLLTAVLHACHVVGLDPYLGLFHQMGYGKPSLALDLMEEFRPVIADALALRLIERRTVRPDDFQSPSPTEAETPPDAPPAARPVYLTADGLKKVIQLWEARLQDDVVDPSTGHTLTWRDLITEQARRMARAFRDEVPYTPFRWG
ncbi:MAG: CRISPR-associated endonuclease Cas1 [Acidobacteria bacterium]|nr:CRISPR-associated endonuclease Cas1 [Acidobacteriota bacterium]MDW7985281.1 CRISPR-associated endonuclease Cas1 [Acidobacteriota bacterium]